MEKNSENKLDLETVISALDSIGKIASALKDKYGIIHKQAFIKYNLNKHLKIIIKQPYEHRYHLYQITLQMLVLLQFHPS